MASASGDAKRAARAAEPADILFNSSRSTRPRNMAGYAVMLGAAIAGFLYYSRKASQAPMDSAIRPAITARYRDMVAEMDQGSATRLHQEQAARAEESGEQTPASLTLNAAMDQPGMRVAAPAATPEEKIEKLDQRLNSAKGSHW